MTARLILLSLKTVKMEVKQILIDQSILRNQTNSRITFGIIKHFGARRSKSAWNKTESSWTRL